MVDQSARFLDVAIGVVDGLGHTVVADGEVLQGTLGLRTPVTISWDHDRPHAVEFSALSRGFQANRDILHCRGGTVVQCGLREEYKTRERRAHWRQAR